jgi:hypothetical protein
MILDRSRVPDELLRSRRDVTRRSLSLRNRGADRKDDGGTSKASRILDKQSHAASTVVGGGLVFPLAIMKEHRDTRNGHEERSDGETPARIESESVDLS